MHPIDCPEWEYSTLPGYETELRRTVRDVLLALWRGEIDTLASARDTRTIHGNLFQRLTPPSHEYYAGHYRGEAYRCLEYYPVGIATDPRVGDPPNLVAGLISNVARMVETSTNNLDAGRTIPDAQLSPQDKLLYTVIAACRIFEFFLRIHPYANGNGHAARFCLAAIMWRYGYKLQSFPIEPRPDPPYTLAITEYRSGPQELLERFVLRCLGSPSP